MTLPRNPFFLLVFLLRGFECMNYLEGPTFIEEPPAKVEFLSETGVRINCSAGGRPAPQIRWSGAQGSPLLDVPGLRYTSMDGALIFSPFPETEFRPDIHMSIYQCQAANSFGTILSVEVHVRAVVNQYFEPEVPDVRASLGFSALLECVVPMSVRDYVKVSSWDRDKSYPILKSDSKYHILPQGQLLIWQVSTAEVHSSFQCRTIHRISGQISVSPPGKIYVTDLEGASSPKFLFKTQNLIVQESNPLAMLCLPSGYPKPSIKWFKKSTSGLSVLIESTSEGKDGPGIQLRHGALFINFARLRDGGTYQCNASNIHGSDLMEVYLTVQLPLTSTLKPERQTVGVGQTAQFHCSTSATETLWLKDGVALRAGSLGGRLRFIDLLRIQITDVRREDQGIYQCLTKNDYESKQKTAQLWVGKDSTLVFKYKFINQTVQPIQQVSLRCSVSEQVKWTWTLDGYPLPASDRFLLGHYTNVYGDVISHVNITSVRNTDSGEYACGAEGRGGKIIHAGRLNVYGELMVRPIPDILAVGGQPLRITCPVGGYPIDEITWHKDGEQLPVDPARQRLVGFKESTLVVEKAEKISDSGVYTCVARRLEQTAEGSGTVNVKEPPVITKFSFPTLTEGERVSVTCVVRSGEVDSIEWVKDNDDTLVGSNTTNTLSSIKISIHHMDNFSISLSIAHLQADVHNGNYTCIARNKFSTTKYTASLVITVRPRISPFFFDENIIEGMTSVEVLCHSQGDELLFQWYKDGGKLMEMSHAGIKISNFSPFSTILTLSNISSDMSGNYTCEVFNGKDSRDVFTTHLLVKVPPKFVAEGPKDHSVPLGTSLAVSCQADGFPKPTIKWQQVVGNLDSKEYRDIGYRTPGIISTQNGSLLFNHVKKDHEGFYICEASNGIGPGPVRKLIRVAVNAAPKIKNRSLKEVVRIGESAKLVCRAEGDQPIRFEWRLSGFHSDLSQDSRYSITNSSADMSELLIRKVGNSDGGQFECIVSNAFGKDSITIFVIGQEKPHIPQNFRVSERASRSLSFSWTAPPESSQVLEFIISYQEVVADASATDSRRKSVPGDDNSVTIPGLLPFTSYMFRVSARNQIGSSEFSEFVKATTGSEAPTGPPLELSVIAVSATELRITWKEPPKEHKNGDIMGYFLYYRRHSDEVSTESWTNQTVHSDAPSIAVSIGELEKFTEYDVVVQAFNKLGLGPNSTIVRGVTREDVSSAPPKEVSCSPLTSSSLQISWQPPPKKNIHGIIQGYRVNLEPVEDDDNNNNNFGELESKATGLVTVIHGLLHYANYSVQVCAITGAGEGVQSAIIYCRTVESVPEAPSAIKTVYKPNSESMIISWLPPKRLNGLLAKYQVYIRTMEHSSGVEIRTLKRTLPPHSLTFEAKDLKKHEKYEAWVTAETGVGEGASSPRVTFSFLNIIRTTLIASFGRIIMKPWKTDITLPCVNVGQHVVWKKHGQKVLESQRIQVLNDSSLNIKSCGKKDTGNYTCSVKNDKTADFIVYQIQVQLPPAAPLLHATSVDHSSVRLQWKTGDTGGSRILGYTLNYRKKADDWEEIRLGSKLISKEINHLTCGTNYEFYITSYNKIGEYPSEILRLQTRPIMPSDSNFLNASTSSITIDFTTWNLSECKVNRLIVEYKGSESNWVLVSNDEFPGRKLTHIHDLTPDTEYTIRIRSRNDKVESTNVYRISTSAFKKGLWHSNFNTGVPHVQVISVALLIVMTALLFCFVGAIFCWRKKTQCRENSSSTVALRDGRPNYLDKTTYELNPQKQIPSCEHIPECADDIYPYATFQLPQKENLSENLQEDFFRGHQRMPVPPKGYPVRQPDYGYERRKSCGSTNRTEDPLSGESEEYDSNGSDSDAPNTLGNAHQKYISQYGKRGNPDLETLQMTDKFERYSHRPQRQKVSYPRGPAYGVSVCVADRKRKPEDAFSKYHPKDTGNHSLLHGLGLKKLNCDKIGLPDRCFPELPAQPVNSLSNPSALVSGSNIQNKSDYSIKV